MRLLTLLFAFSIAAAGCSTDDAREVARYTENTASNATNESGELAAGDQTLSSGEFVDLYEILVREGQWIRVELLSTDFDPYLIVRSPVGTQVDVDDSQANNLTFAKSIVQATDAGQWQILVTTFAAGEAGAYELTYEVSDERPADADDGVQVPVDPTEGV